MQDTTSSAMTEVALGLSMAFFTLLIVALLSMSVPKDSSSNNVVNAVTSVPKDLKNKQTIDLKMNGKQSTDSNNNTMQFAFYFNQKFYDRSLTLRTIDSFSKEIPLVIAVDPKLAFADVFTLKQQIKHAKLSMTTLNSAWRTRLQDLMNQDNL